MDHSCEAVDGKGLFTGGWLFSVCFIVIRESFIVSEHIIVNTPSFISTDTHLPAHGSSLSTLSPEHVLSALACTVSLTTKACTCQHYSTQHAQHSCKHIDQHCPARMYYCFQHAYIIPLIKTHNQQYRYYCHQSTYHRLDLWIIINIKTRCSTSICIVISSKCLTIPRIVVHGRFVFDTDIIITRSSIICIIWTFADQGEGTIFTLASSIACYSLAVECRKRYKKITFCAFILKRLW